MKSNKTLIAVFIGLLLVACICVASAGVLAYTFGDSIVDFIRNDIGSLQINTTSQASPTEESVLVGQDVDLNHVFVPFWESRQVLQEQFYDQPIRDSVLAQGALDGLTAFLADQGVDLAALVPAADAPSADGLAAAASTPTEAAADFAAFWEAWRAAQYGGETVSATYEDMMRAALRGAVDALGDPHTSYMTPFEVQQTNSELQGNYEGIGAWVDTTGDYVVLTPMKDSPAEAAGLLTGDQVIAVDGEDMTGEHPDVVISKILGPAGSTVVLTIVREGESEPFDVSVVRGRINVPSVESELLPEGIAYIQLFQFGVSSADEIHSALEDLLAQNPSGLILDLRNDGGGYLDTAVSITSEFLSDGVVLYEQYSDGSRQTYDVQSGGIATAIPMIVLVNQGTASASEILAGALQDYGRAELVGETTFGKGSVQISRALSNNQGALHVTIAHWFTPDNRQIHGIGLDPDVVVALTAEDAQANHDPQLDKAIELLTESS